MDMLSNLSHFLKNASKPLISFIILLTLQHSTVQNFFLLIICVCVWTYLKHSLAQTRESRYQRNNYKKISLEMFCTKARHIHT